MFIIKNAQANIKRNKKRYFVVGIIMFIVSLISLLSILVNQSTEAVSQVYLNEYGTEANISIDPSTFQTQDRQMVSMDDIETITYEMYQDYADSDYVSSVEYVKIDNLINDELSQPESEDSQDMPKGNITMSSNMENGNSIDFNSLYNIIGADNLENTSYFDENTNTLIDGEFPTQVNEILISSELAEENDLNIDDSIEFRSMNDDKYNFTIVGIYQNLEVSQMPMSQESIYTTFDTVNTSEDEMSNISATYYLTSYDKVDEFQEELYSKGLSDTYYVDNNKSLLNSILGPIESISSILKNISIVMIIIGSAILIFVISLVISDRQYEIGVLRLLGMKSKKITANLAIELIIVTLIVVFLSIIFSFLFAEPIVTYFINNAISSTSNQPTMQMGMGIAMSTSSFDMMGNSQAVTSLNISINMLSIVKLLSINLFIVLLSTIFGASKINKMQPNDILREVK